MPQRFISIEGIARSFAAPGGGTTTVFSDLWLAIARGEFACVIGHSGCGKTTVLNILAGLDALTRGTLQDEVRRICTVTGQTVFMITHDVDEAIYLADRVVLMTNGPDAVLAEIVVNPLPRQRARNDVHRHPLYYGVRNHIIDFLVSRSKSFAAEIKDQDWDRRHVPVVRPGAPEPIVAAQATESATPARIALRQSRA